MTTKHLPKDAKQHLTAGPYSPVLEVDAAKIVVISGQVAIDAQGNVMGNDIEEQTRYTLANCQRQLKSAGCGFSDVFKVNVFLSDITEWARFNAVYSEAMPHPRAVRTTVGAVLLPGFRVEIEMWAAKPT
jgi:2-iminobutanoate/2-iminopropanoate deaminase